MPNPICNAMKITAAQMRVLRTQVPGGAAGVEADLQKEVQQRINYHRQRAHEQALKRKGTNDVEALVTETQMEVLD